MTNLILDNISLILLLPLWIFLIIMCGRFFSVYVNKHIIYLLSLIASFLGAATCLASLLKISQPVEWMYPFLKINDFTLSFGLRIDKLSLVIAVILFVVSFAVQLFSISYMKEEKKNYRFFALLNLFNFCMAFLLFSPNLFQMYVFWELVGIISYLLIGFDYKNPAKSDASRRVFLLNRIGDTALISGIIIVSYYMYTYVGSTSFAGLAIEDLNVISTFILAYASAPALYLICGLFIIAAFVKSAQFPFHTWLQDAMEAKLPVSALLHSATMVVAGIYLSVRLLPFFTLNNNFMLIILYSGLLTALLCSILASFETVPKKILAYSTSANLGLMFAAIGMGNIKAAIILLTAHAFIKSALFLALPNEENNLSRFNIILFWINALSLAGIILCGLSAKEIMFSGFVYHKILGLIFMVISFATAFYISRLALIIQSKSGFSKNTNMIECISLIILLCGNFVLYFILRKNYTLSEPFVSAFGGICLSLLLYKHSALEKLKNIPKLSEKFNYFIIPNLYNKIANILNIFEVSVLSNYKQILNLLKIPVQVTNRIETDIMNRSVNFTAKSFKLLSDKDAIIQTGNVQSYNAYAFIITTLVIAVAIIVYTKLIN